MPLKRSNQIVLNIDQMLNKYDRDGNSTTKTVDGDFSLSSDDGDYSVVSSAASDDSFNSSDDESDNENDIDEGVFMDELQSWMANLAVSKKTIKRTNSMHLMGAVNTFPKYKETVNHHPIVAHRMRQCKGAYFQSADEVKAARQEKEDKTIEKPEDCVMKIFAEAGYYDPMAFAPDDDAFLKVTDERVAAHSKDLTDAARQNNLKLLKQFHKQGRNLRCCNRFGESIVHIACRRGAPETLSFLLGKAKGSVMVRDDFGRNPMHDAAWTEKPNFELVKILLETNPKLLLAKDKRGSTPLAYIPRPKWAQWCDFLKENQNLLVAAANM